MYKIMDKLNLFRLWTLNYDGSFVIWMINETVEDSVLPTVEIWNQWSFELETCLLFTYLLLL